MNTNELKNYLLNAIAEEFFYLHQKYSGEEIYAYQICLDSDAITAYVRMGTALRQKTSKQSKWFTTHCNLTASPNEQENLDFSLLQFSKNALNPPAIDFMADVNANKNMYVEATRAARLKVSKKINIDRVLFIVSEEGEIELEKNTVASINNFLPNDKLLVQDFFESLQGMD